MEENTTKGIMIFSQNLKDFCYLNDEQAGKVIKGLANYFLEGTEPEDLGEPIVQMVFAHLKENADWSLAKYQNVCARNRKVTESRKGKKTVEKSGGKTSPEKNLVECGHQKPPKKNLVESGHQNIFEKNLGDQNPPVVQYNIIQSNTIQNKLNKVEVEVDSNSDSNSDHDIFSSSDPALRKLQEECYQYLDTDEEDVVSNLQVLLRTYSPEEIKNAVIRSYGYNHSTNWGYITTVCKNTRKEKELIQEHNIRLN